MKTTPSQASFTGQFSRNYIGTRREGPKPIETEPQFDQTVVKSLISTLKNPHTQGGMIGGDFTYSMGIVPPDSPEENERVNQEMSQFSVGKIASLTQDDFINTIAELNVNGDRVSIHNGLSSNEINIAKSQKLDQPGSRRASMVERFTITEKTMQKAADSVNNFAHFLDGLLTFAETKDPSSLKDVSEKYQAQAEQPESILESLMLDLNKAVAGFIKRNGVLNREDRFQESPSQRGLLSVIKEKIGV